MTQLVHRIRGHTIHREVRYWYDPPGEMPRGPYATFSCSCGAEWARSSRKIEP